MLVFAVTLIGRYYRLTVSLEVKGLLGINADDEIELVFEDNEVVIGERGE